MKNVDRANLDKKSDIEVDIFELIVVISNGKKLIFAITFFISIIAIIYSLFLPNIYESKAVLVPQLENNISTNIQNYSALASLAGVNLPAQGSSKPIEAKQKLNSFSFFDEHILPNIFLPELMAVKAFNIEKMELEFDEKIYDQSNNKWVRKFSYPQKLVPSSQESYKVFITNHLDITEDKKTGFITLKIKHQSPYAAMQLVELMTAQINSFYRVKDKQKAEKSVAFINQQIASTNFAEIKQVLANILQQEMQKLVLIEANKSYVYEYLDPPAVMERKSEPSRALIVFLGAFFGILLGVIIVILRHFRKTTAT